MTNELRVRKFKDDRLLQLINREVVSLKDVDIERNNKILQGILETVVSILKEKNEFFREFYRNTIFTGSFYKGTKVGKPDEFDLNLVIELPLQYKLIKFRTIKPEYVMLKVKGKCRKTFGWENHRKILGKFLSRKGHLKPNEFRNEMESIFSNIPQNVTIDDRKYELKMQKCGPAFTLWVSGSDTAEMSVDLVPVLEFNRPPPLVQERSGDYGTESWFAVPKPSGGRGDTNPQWRMSLYLREKAIMLKSCQYLRPMIRLLKKLRDTQGWEVLVSFRIETLVLQSANILEAQSASEECSLTEHFVTMLEQLQEACKNKRITDYWDSSHNLIGKSSRIKLEPIEKKLGIMIEKIRKDPFAIADFILTKEERSSIQEQLNRLRATGNM